MNQRHTIAAAARAICGDDSGLRDPERWVAVRLWDGRFSGIKIGRRWFMTDSDIESAIETCRRGSHAPAIPSAVEDSPASAAAVSITDGLSARARKRRAS